MSASKKKQQRREAVDVEKVTEAQAKQAAYKKKARLYTIIGIVVAVLVVVLLVWNSGIFQKNATAATIGDDKLSVAELSFYYYDVRQMYAQYGMIDSNMNDAETVLNSADGTTYQDYFLEQALSDAQRYHVLYEDALKEGRTAADVKDSVDSQIANLKASAKAYGYDYKAFLKALYGRYATPTLVEKKAPHHVPADSELVTALLAAYTEETGTPAEPMSTGGGTYAKVLKQGVAFGAGFPEDPDLAHQANEHVCISKMMLATKIYANALVRLAGK
jgi:hypothetical protein